MKIHSVFESINGEVSLSHQGSLCTFIRFAGCNLSCEYCDTVYAQKKESGKEMSVTEIVHLCSMIGNKNITITGGEPLIQVSHLFKLVLDLHKFDYCISIETNGSCKIPRGWPGVSWVVDWKGPSSGMRKRMKLENFYDLYDDDFIKFVIADYNDFSDAMMVITEIVKDKGIHRPQFAFSPSYAKIDPAELVCWMSGEKLLKSIGAIFSLQIHKVIKVD